ncbi:MAG TPA: DUF1579 domain-containing protein [Thermoanaerobaculia bacterium]|nr:DUF1579 domain-containing protein [Thermoanaerobaculia bacterium]
MNIRPFVAALSLLALTTVPAMAQDKPKETPPPGMDQAAMEAMMKAMTPGENHKHIARYAGDWTFTNKMWMDPSQPPAESSGTMHGETILDGRYVQATWKGNMMGTPFEGRGTHGYDNLSKQYVSTWIDNMATGIMYSTGTCDAAGKRCEDKGDMMDPMTGQKSYMRTVTTWTSDKSFTMEMYGPGPSGQEVKMMEFVVTKK